MSESLLLVHGLWMRGITMRWLATRLRSRDFEPRTFEYFSLLQDTDAVVARLADALRQRPRTHVVAHSLGGLLALRAAERVGAANIAPTMPAELSSPWSPRRPSGERRAETGSIFSVR